MATSAQVFKLLLIIKDNGPSQDYYHLDDQTTRPCEIKKNICCVFLKGAGKGKHTLYMYTHPIQALVISGKTFVYY